MGKTYSLLAFRDMMTVLHYVRGKTYSLLAFRDMMTVLHCVRGKTCSLSVSYTHLTLPTKRIV